MPVIIQFEIQENHFHIGFYISQFPLIDNCESNIVIRVCNRKHEDEED